MRKFLVTFFSRTDICFPSTFSRSIKTRTVNIESTIEIELSEGEKANKETFMSHVKPLYEQAIKDASTYNDIVRSLEAKYDDDSRKYNPFFSYALVMSEEDTQIYVRAKNSLEKSQETLEHYSRMINGEILSWSLIEE